MKKSLVRVAVTCAAALASTACSEQGANDSRDSERTLEFGIHYYSYRCDSLEQHKVTEPRVEVFDGSGQLVGTSNGGYTCEDNPNDGRADLSQPVTVQDSDAYRLVSYNPWTGSPTDHGFRDAAVLADNGWNWTW